MSNRSRSWLASRHRRARASSVAAGAVLAALLITSGASTSPRLQVGIVSGAFQVVPGETRSFVDELDLDITAITLRWRRGQDRMSARQRRQVGNATGLGRRVVASLFNLPPNVPRTRAARARYCDFAADVVRRTPVRDVILWNEVNLTTYWGRRENAARDYYLLLARCYDALHEARPDVNIAAFATVSTRCTLCFIREVAAFYRRSGRTRPIFDAVAHHPYPLSVNEPVWRSHDRPVRFGGRRFYFIGLGDARRLRRAVDGAFRGTAQGRRPAAIWWTEVGIGTPGTTTHPWLTSSRQHVLYRSMIRLSHCQPRVEMFLTFQLWDDGHGWDTGVLDIERRPKRSYAAVRGAIADVRAGRAACGRYPRASR